jgi:hypothetical protein
MPDWSPDGTTIIYTLPSKVLPWTLSTFGVSMTRANDDHELGGSLYTLAYLGNLQFGTPSEFLASQGENNYYPSYSPDGKLVIFDRAPLSGTIDACSPSAPPGESCPNDSFSNPAARLTLIQNAAGAVPVDLQAANGSPASAPQSLSNSWPKWGPVAQTYKGRPLLWVVFSSTRDYGVRVRNHKAGMYQCYPPDSAEWPTGTHGSTFDPLCQQPQLWMAAVSPGGASGTDPSFPAFWLPIQAVTKHNHTPQWGP